MWTVLSLVPARATLIDVKTPAALTSVLRVSLARSLSEDRDAPFHRPMPEREPIAETRGGDMGGVSIHSVRMPGRMAHHEVILGAAGQTLSLKHDTINRECYMPGVALAVREVSNWKGLVVGLDKLLGL